MNGQQADFSIVILTSTVWKASQDSVGGGSIVT